MEGPLFLSAHYPTLLLTTADISRITHLQEMQSLLSPSESHAFQSFLSSMDYPEDSNLSASEWAMYTSSGTGQEDPLGEEAPQNPEHREALTKATKDLMSLDTDRWTSSSDLSMDHRPEMAQQLFNRYGNHAGMDQDRMQGRQQLSHQQQIQHLQQQQQQRHNSFSRAQGSFAMHHPQHLQHTGTSHESAAHLSHRPSPAVSSPTVVSGSGPSRQKRMSLSLSTAQAVPIASTSGSASTSSSSIPNSATASSSHLNGRPHVNGSTNGAAPPTGPHSNKQARISPSPPTTIGVNPSSTGAPGLPKQQALLSPSQKKANHIQSEQKRRANIRRGYEALCETVPALREAIREEEEAMENAKAAGGKAAAAGKKKVRGRKGQGGNAKDDDKERIDGRAGPRSENVVLSKTIDHIQALLSDRSSLLARLHRARSSLPPGHPALTPLVPDPPWEREWKGGEGKLGGVDEDGDDGSESDE